MEMKRNGAVPDRRKVSYRDETQWSHAGQETIRKKFPAAMKHSRVMPDGKPFANSFLS